MLSKEAFSAIVYSSLKIPDLHLNPKPMKYKSEGVGANQILHKEFGPRISCVEFEASISYTSCAVKSGSRVFHTNAVLKVKLYHLKTKIQSVVENAAHVFKASLSLA